jgi:hypothetical protein
VIFRRQARRWAKQRREFVYLDEISVTSLIASRDGAIKETVKETLTHSTEREGKTSAASTLKAVKFSAESRAKRTDTSANEVVRKAVIQSTFRDLRTGGHDELVLALSRKPRRREVRPHSLATARDVARHKKKLERHGHLLRASDIRRGDVLELEVLLSADQTYQLVSAASSIVDIVKGREALFGIDKAEYDQVVSVLEVIDGLLVGLVPICGTSRDYAVLELSGEEYLVNQGLIDPDGELRHEIRPLEIVGVTSFSSYSRDLRRVLFAEESYTTYVRVESATLRDAWQPVKLAGVLEKMSINVGELMSLLPDGVAAAKADGRDGHSPSTADWEDALTRFGEALAAECGATVDDQNLRTCAIQAASMLTADGSVESRRSAFDVVVRAIDPQADRESVRLIREAVQAACVARAEASPVLAETVPAPQTEPTRKLEVEFVAIYW